MDIYERKQMLYILCVNVNTNFAGFVCVLYVCVLLLSFFFICFIHIIYGSNFRGILQNHCKNNECREFFFCSKINTKTNNNHKISGLL